MSLLRKLHQPVCLGANAESWQLCYWLLREGKRRKKQPREEEEEETAERERGLGLSGSKRGFSHRDHCFAQASQGTGGYSNIYKGRAVISPGDRVHLSVTTSPHTQSPPACWHLLRSKKNKSAALWLKRGGTNVTESLRLFFAGLFLPGAFFLFFLLWLTWERQTGAGGQMTVFGCWTSWVVDNSTEGGCCGSSVCMQECRFPYGGRPYRLV